MRISLSIAAVKEELTVRATAAEPTAADGNLNGVQIDSDLLKSLPAQDSNPLAAAALFVDPAANGNEGTAIVVDGVEGGALDVPSSGVRRVSVNKNPYSPEFSRPGRGRIEVQTRRGSPRHFHRRLTITARDAAFDARNAFATQRPDMRRILSEFEMDGPLPRDFGTFYVGGDYLVDNEQSFVRAVTPDGAVSQDVRVPERLGHAMARTDLRLSPVNTLSLRYSFMKDTLGNQGAGGFDLAERAYNSTRFGHEVRVGDTHAFASGILNELRFVFKQKTRQDSALDPAGAIIVKGAFHSGGAQLDASTEETSYHVEDIVGLTRGAHTLRFGGGIRRRTIDLLDRSNFGGTLTFSSIADFLAGRPTLFTRNAGTPSVNFGYVDYDSFAQDEIKLRSDLGLMLGLRHEYQSLLHGRANFAPRFALSFAPGQAKTVLRIGGGIFYERESEAMQQLQQLFDGNHLKQVVISNPTSLAPDISSALGSITQGAATLRSPYLIQASVAVERKISAKTFLSVEYTTSRGVHRFRSRDVTALASDPAFAHIYEFESTGSSRANSLNATLRSSFSQFEVMATYTLSKSMDDTAGPFSFPANSLDLRSEWGRSDFDRRHRFNLAGIVRMPHEFKLGAVVQASSAMPLNVTSGADVNGAGILADRPSGIARNTASGPGFLSVDLRLSRRFVLASAESKRKSPYLEFRLDAFNVLNTVNAPAYVGVITSPLFGKTNSALAPRQMQASVRIGF